MDSLQRRVNVRNVSFRFSLRWPTHIINPDDKTKLSCNTPHRRSTTVSLETYPSIQIVKLLPFESWTTLDAGLWSIWVTSVQVSVCWRQKCILYNNGRDTYMLYYNSESNGNICMRASGCRNTMARMRRQISHPVRLEFFERLLEHFSRVKMQMTEKITTKYHKIKI